MIPILAPIDLHVHLRGVEYADHDFARMAFEDAYASGVIGLREMPNALVITDPSQPPTFIVNPDVADVRRARLAGLAASKAVRYGVNIGLTPDHEQNRRTFRQTTPHTFVKAFFCHSTGNMGVTAPSDQRQLWRDAATSGFHGVFMGHFEDEACFSAGTPFDATCPVTHSMHQPAYAEVRQVRQQLYNAKETGFEGTFYICHITTMETLALVQQFKQQELPRFRIVTEVTWHHLLLNTNAYAQHGNRAKCNPPLRESMVQRQLLRAVLRGEVDVIATDHAPHPLARKDDQLNPASGLPGLPVWPLGIRVLLKAGINPHDLNRMIHVNPAVLCGWTDLLGVRWGYGGPRPEVHNGLWEKYGYCPYENAEEPCPLTPLST